MRFCRTEFKNVLKLEWAEEVVVREIVYAEQTLIVLEPYKKLIF